MKKIILIILVGIAAASSALFLIPENSPQPQLTKTYENDFTFYDVEKIQSTLAKQNIHMTTPTAITDHTRSQYCTFFDEQNTKTTTDYCTTTAILDPDGNPLGNINMGGTINETIMALAIIDSSPFLDSRDNEVNAVFQTMIDTLVCDCWEEQQPGGFESVNAWLSAAEEKYAESSKTTKSKITGLDNKTLILEITSTDESYLWTLIVLK